MTAPAVPTAPAAPVTPAVPAAPAAPEAPAPRSRAEVMASIVEQLPWKDDAQLRGAPAAPVAPTTPAAPPAAPAPAVPPGTAPAAAPPVQGLAPDGGEGTSPMEGTPPPAPEGTPPGEGEVAPPPEAVIGEGKERIVVRALDGTYAPAPAVKVEFTVGEKKYLKDTQELVRMARDGIAGQQAVQQSQRLREAVPRLEQTVQLLQEELQAQAELNREMLSDEEKYIARRAQWQELMSPEARADRAERRLQEVTTEEQTRAEQQARAAQVQAFYREQIKPVQDELLGGYKQVPDEAKIGRFLLDTAPLTVNGVIPPERLGHLRAYLDGPFRQWVKAEAERIDQERRETEARIARTVDEERRRAQGLVQNVGRALAPNGAPASAHLPPAPPPPPPTTRDEALRFIVSRPMVAG